jgi:threonine dehydrogenase-like Zn-dependent dehydrogenase
MTEQIRAVRLFNNADHRDVALQRLAPPRPGAGELLLMPLAVGLCGSDFSACSRQPGKQAFSGKLNLPVTLGHEFCAKVGETASSSSVFRVGDIVVGPSVLGCGTCPTCLKGLTNYCSDARLLGLTTDGCFTERFVYPEKFAVNASMCPEGIDQGDWIEVATFAEPVACMVRALKKQDRLLTEGRKALIVGLGTLGYAASVLLSKVHKMRVFAIDESPVRCAIARRILDVRVTEQHLCFSNATRTISQFGANGHFDIIIEVAGLDQETLSVLPSFLSPEGTLLYLARAGRTWSIGLDDFVTGGFQLSGSRGQTASDVQTSIDFLRDNVSVFKEFITRRVGFGEIKNALQQCSKKTEAKTIFSLS